MTCRAAATAVLAVACASEALADAVLADEGASAALAVLGATAALADAVLADEGASAALAVLGGTAILVDAVLADEGASAALAVLGGTAILVDAVLADETPSATLGTKKVFCFFTAIAMNLFVLVMRKLKFIGKYCCLSPHLTLTDSSMNCRHHRPQDHASVWCRLLLGFGITCPNISVSANLCTAIMHC